jgi:histidine triad (HIT) family protein
MSDSNQLCPFCIQNNLLRVNVLYQDDMWYITDMEEGSINNAVMAITKRHIETPFDINEDEWISLHALLRKMKKLVDEKETPDGYNLGWNVHKTGGQNVAHAHLHLLARYDDEPLSGKGIRYAFKQLENQRETKK